MDAMGQDLKAGMHPPVGRDCYREEGAYTLHKFKHKANLHIIILKYLFNTYLHIYIHMHSSKPLQHVYIYINIEYNIILLHATKVLDITKHKPKDKGPHTIPHQ